MKCAEILFLSGIAQAGGLSALCEACKAAADRGLGSQADATTSESRDRGNELTSGSVIATFFAAVWLQDLMMMVFALPDNAGRVARHLASL